MKHRLLVTGMGCLFSVGLIYLVYNYSKPDSFETISVLVSVVSLLAILIPFVIKFLNSDQQIVEARQELRKMRNSIDQEGVLDKYIRSNLTVEKLEASILDKVMGTVEDHLTEKFARKYGDDSKKEQVLKIVHRSLFNIEENIQKYIFKLQRNSIINLVIGIIGTSISITILSFSILSTANMGDIQGFIIHYLPRVTFVVFIQVFAFFFLRLYKNNLSDARYFQNELTNISSKNASIRIAHVLGRDQLIDILIKELSTVERNFKLAKDESLLNIEIAKMEKEIDHKIVDILQDHALLKDMPRSGGKNDSVNN